MKRKEFNEVWRKSVERDRDGGEIKNWQQKIKRFKKNSVKTIRHNYDRRNNKKSQSKSKTIMTKEAKKLFLNWSASRPISHQRILTAGIEDSQEKGEEITKEVAGEIIKATEEIIKSRKANKKIS